MDRNANEFFSNFRTWQINLLIVSIIILILIFIIGGNYYL